MNILLAPNAFKGSLTASEAAKHMAKGFRQSKLECELIAMPIADGGDGSLEVVTKYLSGQIHTCEVSNPVNQLVLARYGWLEKEKTAVIEMAEASGIRLLDKKDLNPWRLTSFGTGELIKEAIDKGAKTIYLALGGSATVDGGLGILHALGVQFFNVHGETMVHIDMSTIQEIDTMDMATCQILLAEIQIIVLCDVTNPIVGENGAAAVFGPQKGLVQKDIAKMDAALSHLCELITKTMGADVSSVAGGGAAGGIAAILSGLFGAEIISGGEQILKWSGFYDILPVVDIVITGEGKIDSQTALGKGPGLIAAEAKKAGKKVIGLCGAVGDQILHYKNFDSVIPIINKPTSLKNAMAMAAQNLERTAFQIGNMLA